METTENLNFAHSSWKGWYLLRPLAAAPHAPATKSTISPNQIALQIKEIAESATLNKEDKKTHSLITPFTNEGVNMAIEDLKVRKAGVADNISPKFLKHLRPAARTRMSPEGI
ncbi:hypothetical protein Trydic_g21597 [Trypoxylus dichotomus]